MSYFLDDDTPVFPQIPPQYDCVEHWNEELERLKVVGYRADTFNTGFRTCQRFVCVSKICDMFM